MAQDQPDLSEVLQRAFRYALALTHDRAVAEDLVQDACLSLSKRGGPWDVGYVLTCVRNRNIDRLRRMRKIKFQAWAETDDVASDADSNVETEASLEDALGRLKEDERELLYLAVVEEQTSQQIATLTGRPLGTVLSSVHRTKLKMRQWLAPYVRGGSRSRTAS